jgi:hypothetical protein
MQEFHRISDSTNEELEQSSGIRRPISGKLISGLRTHFGHRRITVDNLADLRDRQIE